MKEFETEYGPIELRVGDIVKVRDVRDDYFQERGKVVSILMDGGINVDFGVRGLVIYEPCQLTLISTATDKQDNVSEFRKIIEQMAETYERKDATYGNAY